MLSQNWELHQNGVRLPVVFVAKKDAIAYAEENLQGEYVLVFDHHLRGATETVRQVGQK